MQSPRSRGAFVRRAVPAVVLVGAIVASYMGFSAWRQQRSDVWVSTSPRHPGESVDANAAANPFASANGTHLIAFVVTASECGWSNQPAVMDAIGALRTTIRSAHKESFAHVSVVGVLLDENLDEGLRFASDMGKGRLDGAFDQLIIGGSWLNEQIVRMVWRDRVARAATPQVLVIQRSVNTQGYLTDKRIFVEGDTVVANVVGGSDLLSWVSRGMPLEGKAVTRLETPTIANGR